MLTRLTAVLLALTFCATGCKRKPDVDLSSPKSTAYAFITAIDKGDAQTALACVNVQNESQRKLADAYIATGIAYNKLQKAANAKFGDSAGRLAGEDNPLAFLDALDSLDEKIVGETATLEPKAGKHVMSFRKIENQWKIDVGTIPDGRNMPSDMAVVPRLEMMTRIYNKAADEIAVGTYETAPKARQAIDRKIREGLFEVMSEAQP